jgi:4'-phosphopantetheinyl transferase
LGINQLNTDSIQIWHGNIAAEDADYQSYWRVLDAAERAHAEKIKNDLLHKRYVETHGRLRNILGKILNEPPERININKTEHGKPYLADAPELVFNLSHSGNAMVIAVSWNCQLGVDMEYCKPRTSLAGLVDKCFAEEESRYWYKLSEAQKITEFYRFWTRKEAFVKATGRGIGLGLNRCVINPESQGEFLRIPAEYGQASMWHALDITLGQGACCALVTDKDIVEIEQCEG